MSAYPTSLLDRGEAAFLRGLMRLPHRALTALAGGPLELDGQRLDPEVRLLLQVMAADPRPKMEDQPPPGARATIRHAAAS